MRIQYCASLPFSSSYLPFRISKVSNCRHIQHGISPIRLSLSQSTLNPNPLMLSSKFERYAVFSSFESSTASRPRFSRQLAAKVRAHPASETARDQGPISGGIVQIFELGLMFGLWYFSNIYFSICNKELLKVFPYPITITAFHFFLGTMISLLLWGFKIYKKPTCTPYQILLILPLALTHTFGNLLTNVSFGKVAVSFTHTIKAMEPFFSVLFSALFLGEIPSVWVLLSLFPVIGGVGLASLTEASFNWPGFLSAMASNVVNQSRNVFSKKLMVNETKEDAITSLNLFFVITIISFIILTTIALLVDGVKFTPTYLKSTGINNVNEIYVKALITGFCFHFSQQASFLILGKVSPVTHSVGNCLKRVVVIVTSLIFFHTQVSPINAFGTGIALTGVFLYSMVKRKKARSH